MYTQLMQMISQLLWCRRVHHKVLCSFVLCFFCQSSIFTVERSPDSSCWWWLPRHPALLICLHKAIQGIKQTSTTMDQLISSPDDHKHCCEVWWMACVDPCLPKQKVHSSTRCLYQLAFTRHWLHWIFLQTISTNTYFNLTRMVVDHSPNSSSCYVCGLIT